ncbi:hypothetical protein [Sphaerisporangium album]|uniref:hypothetical protein n=1 Tax=Sphaerisporangium album TaxID=509200 RepID=UPI003CCC8D75
MVQAVIDSGGNCAQAARAFVLVPETVRTWVRAAEKKRQEIRPRRAMRSTVPSVR